VLGILLVDKIPEKFFRALIVFSTVLGTIFLAANA